MRISYVGSLVDWNRLVSGLDRHGEQRATPSGFVQSDGNADAPPPQRDGERAQGRERGEHRRHAGEEGQAPPRPEEDPRGGIDEHVLKDPRGERIAADGEQPAREGEAPPLERGGGEQERHRGGGGDRDEAGGADRLVEGDADPTGRRRAGDGGGGDDGRARQKRVSRRAGREPSADQ